jgi:flagellar protein FlbD
MIRLTRLNRAILVLNSDLIEHIDVTPDTVITLTTGQILRVRETADEVINRIVEFRRRASGPEVRTGEWCEADEAAHPLDSLPGQKPRGESD